MSHADIIKKNYFRYWHRSQPILIAEPVVDGKCMQLTDTDNTQQIEFGYPEKYTKPGMWISGGADSAILLYTLIAYLRETGREHTSRITLMTCANDQKLRWNAARAAAVIDEILALTKTSCIDRHVVIYRDVQDVRYFHELHREMIDSGRIDILLSGKTANPPQNTAVMIEDLHGNLRDIVSDPHRSADRDVPDQPVLTEYQHAAFYNPFLHSDKRLVAGAYEKFGIKHRLLPLTRSCETIPVSDEMAASIRNNEPCGVCWWCLERKWAFGHW